MFHKVDYFEYCEPAESLKEKAQLKNLLEKITNGICETRKSIRSNAYYTLTDLATGGVIFLGKN